MFCDCSRGAGVDVGNSSLTMQETAVAYQDSTIMSRDKVVVVGTMLTTVPQVSHIFCLWMLQCNFRAC